MPKESVLEQAYDAQRDRGILTPDDREYLLGQKEYSHSQGARRRRARIRERVYNAFLDFIILEYMEPRDLEQVFGEMDNNESPRFGAAFANAFYFIYETLVRVQPDYEHVDLNLEVYLQQAIEVVDQSRGYRSEIIFEITREEHESPSEIFERAKEEGIISLTGSEFELLWRSEEVDAAAFAEYLNDLFPDEDNIRPIDIIKEREAWKQHSERRER